MKRYFGQVLMKVDFKNFLEAWQFEQKRSTTMGLAEFESISKRSEGYSSPISTP